MSRTSRRGPTWGAKSKALCLAALLVLIAVGIAAAVRTGPDETSRATGTAASSSPTPVVMPTLLPHVNPFAGATGYVDPRHIARAEAAERRAWDPTGAEALDKVASGPRANWITDSVRTWEVAEVVDEVVSRQTDAGALPVLVAYAIPHRDCGNYSAGGLDDASSYGAWIEELARGIGPRAAVVVLEPDALALMGCLDADDREERMAMLRHAVDVLGALPATGVYIDAGGPGWHPAEVMARRLKAAGVADARGFSLNVSNFADDEANLRYGTELSGLVGGKHFIVDTSRNGVATDDTDPDITWCNPPGRALGARFTTDTGNELADAFTWIKTPGESDGTCGGGPPAGHWWTEYAIDLGQRTQW